MRVDEKILEGTGKSFAAGGSPFQRAAFLPLVQLFELSFCKCRLLTQVYE